jgi:nucleoid-associated protein YgaU
MDFFIKYSDTEILRLPVTPPDFTIQQGNLVQSVNVTNIGEVSVWGPEKLATISIATFFPYNYHPTYCSYIDFPKPWDCVDKINAWRNSGKTVRLIITDKGKDVDINMGMYIESFESKMQDASGDVYFTISFRQFKKITVPQEAGSVTIREAVRPAPPSVPQTSSSGNGQRTHKVVRGDTLWGLAKKYYGNGSKYPTIAKANSKIKDPNLIIDGWVLIIP